MVEVLPCQAWGAEGEEGEAWFVDGEAIQGNS